MFSFLKLILFSLLLNPILVFGSSQIVIDSSDEKLNLISNSCNNLEIEYKAISQWVTRVEGKINSHPMPSCVCEANICSIDIKKTTTKFTQAQQGKLNEFMGPNCYNSALVTAGILPHANYTSRVEMNFWMNSPLCREKDLSEEISPGDIIAIKDNGQFYHGMVHISENLIFSKNGNSTNGHYYFDTQKSLYSDKGYDIKKECERIPLNRDENTNQCQRSVHIFSCQTWDDFIKDSELSPQKKEILEDINTIDCKLSKHVFNQRIGLNKSHIEDAIITLQALALKRGALAQEDPDNPGYYKPAPRPQGYFDDVGRFGERPNNPKEKELFWELVYNRAYSLGVQMNSILQNKK